MMTVGGKGLPGGRFAVINVVIVSSFGRIEQE
jgi:hypothetical protein